MGKVRERERFGVGQDVVVLLALILDGSNSGDRAVIVDYLVAAGRSWLPLSSLLGIDDEEQLLYRLRLPVHSGDQGVEVARRVALIGRDLLDPSGDPEYLGLQLVHLLTHYVPSGYGQFPQVIRAEKPGVA